MGEGLPRRQALDTPAPTSAPSSSQRCGCFSQRMRRAGSVQQGMLSMDVGRLENTVRSHVSLG